MSQIIKDVNDLVLRTPASRVSGGGWKRLPKLVKEMTAAMREEKGLGVAAPQVGVSLRVVVLYDKTVMVNPRIEEYKGHKKLMPEGCLSIPGKTFLVNRYPEIKVTYQDRNGKAQFDHCVGTDAQLIQHELDHLEGTLICDIGEPAYNR